MRASTLASWALAATLALPFPAAAADKSEAEIFRILDQAKAKASSIHGQAAELAMLAWPDEGEPDPLVAAAAIEQLVGFGHNSLRALRRGRGRVRRAWQPDVVATLIEARRRNLADIPSDYLSGLEEAIWFGPIEAKRMAMSAIARYQYPAAVITIIDAIYEHPQLAKPGIEALAMMRDDRARFFLGDLLLRGEPELRRLAASGLSRIGDRALYPLREAARSQTPDVRNAAIEALLPVSGTDDLTLFHEYLGLAEDREDALRERVLSRTVALEEQLQRETDEQASGD